MIISSRMFCARSGAVFFACMFSLLMLGSAMTHAESQIDIYPFADEAEERRYKGLIEEFRCPKCLNTNLAGSDAPIAKDLRGTPTSKFAITCERAMETLCSTIRLFLRKPGTSG